MNDVMISGQLPILALRGLVIFPDQTIHFDIGRSKSKKALEAAMKADQTLFLAPQKDIVQDDPDQRGLYSIGTVAKVKQVLKTQGDNLRVLVSGVCRARIARLDQTEPYLMGQIEAVPEAETIESPRNHALCREANLLYGIYSELVEHPSQTTQLRMMASNNVGFIADSIGQNSGIDYPDKAKLLC
jgi:ATP-dependent Lon protease